MDIFVCVLVVYCSSIEVIGLNGFVLLIMLEMIGKYVVGDWVLYDKG